MPVPALITGGMPTVSSGSQMTMVGIKFGGQPVTDYAPDFWLMSDDADSDACGYITSPWYSPELEVNIALAWVPVEKREIGTRFAVWLPDEYATMPGMPVDAEVVEVPFRPSVNANAREKAKAAGRDYAY